MDTHVGRGHPLSDHFTQFERLLRGPHPDERVNILLVEDHFNTASALALLLRIEGYNVCVAARARDALQLVERTKFDLVISDIGLPDGDGCSLMARLHERAGLNGIALTGFSSLEESPDLRDSGFVKTLVKPVEFKDLFAAIQSVTER